MDMIQIAASKYILLIDSFVIRSDPYLFSQISTWIAIIMNSTTIEKVFFDCRKDSEALHKGLHCCINNVYDIQAMHMFLSQWKSSIPLKNTGDILAPGLNVSLEEFKASHGINEAKETMKQIFFNQHGTYEIRPLSLMYIRYAAKDVEDLVEIKEKMLCDFTSTFNDYKTGKKVAEILSKSYSEQGCKAGIQGILEQLNEFIVKMPMKQDGTID